MLPKYRFFQIFNFNDFKGLSLTVRQKKLVEEPEIGMNRPYLIDFIKINTSPKLIGTSEIKAFYLRNGLSAAQIAEKYGVSKSFVLAVIHRSGLTTSKAGRSTNPANYRNNSPPYGYSVRDGKLVPNKSQMKICRIVVELRVAARIFDNPSCPRT